MLKIFLKESFGYFFSMQCFSLSVYHRDYNVYCFFEQKGVSYSEPLSSKSE